MVTYPSDPLKVAGIKRELKRGEASLILAFPLPLDKGKGDIRGMGSPKKAKGGEVDK